MVSACHISAPAPAHQVFKTHSRIFFVTRCRLDVVWYPPRARMQFLAIPICPMTFKRPHHFIKLYQQKVPSNIHVIHVSSEGCAKNPKNPQSAARQQFSRILFCCFCGSRSDLPNRGLHPGLPELPERSGAATLFVSLLSQMFHNCFIINFSSCKCFPHSVGFCFLFSVTRPAPRSPKDSQDVWLCRTLTRKGYLRILQCI